MSGAGVVATFLEAMAAHDWDTVGGCVADDVVRVGPYGDKYRGRDAYVTFIRDLLPTLPGYSMAVERIVADGPVVVAELSETVDGHVTPEALVFDVDGDDRIASIKVFIQRWPSP